MRIVKEIAYTILDKGIYEFFGRLRIVNLFFKLPDKLNKLQSGQINFYIYITSCSLVMIIFFSLFFFN